MLTLTAEQVIAWLERNHYDLIYTTTWNNPRWVVGNRHNDDEIAQGATILEAISKASQELLRAGSL